MMDIVIFAALLVANSIWGPFYVASWPLTESPDSILSHTNGDKENILNSLKNQSYYVLGHYFHEEIDFLEQIAEYKNKEEIFRYLGQMGFSPDHVDSYILSKLRKIGLLHHIIYNIKLSDINYGKIHNCYPDDGFGSFIQNENRALVACRKSPIYFDTHGPEQKKIIVLHLIHHFLSQCKDKYAVYKFVVDNFPNQPYDKELYEYLKKKDSPIPTLLLTKKPILPNELIRYLNDFL